jgi:hypothetical protein
MKKTDNLSVMPSEVQGLNFHTWAPNTAVYEHIMTEFDDS